MAREEKMKYTGSSIWQKVDKNTGEKKYNAVTDFEVI